MDASAVREIAVLESDKPIIMRSKTPVNRPFGGDGMERRQDEIHATKIGGLPSDRQKRTYKEHNNV
jgi:hypothetical protein